MAGLSKSQWGGYILEEVVAWMLATSGYRLLTDVAHDPEEFASGGNGLRVRGRGAMHQADVLGELSYVPPFSLPIRMFVEAKCWKTERVKLESLRNAYGVVQDVNQNWASSSRTSGLRQRYNYLYALFSTSGFSADAQEYALAHQIFLVDLSTTTFSPLVKAIGQAAARVVDGSALPSSPVPVQLVRRKLRQLFGTEPPYSGLNFENESFDLLPSGPVAAALRDLANFVLSEWKARLILGFPAAPLILALTTDDLDSVTTSLREIPVQQVDLRHLRRGESAGMWEIELEGLNSRLLFTLPDRIEAWLAQIPEEGQLRRSLFRSSFLSDITVVVSEGHLTTLHKLFYQPQDWRERS